MSAPQALPPSTRRTVLLLSLACFASMASQRPTTPCPASERTPDTGRWLAIRAMGARAQPGFDADRTNLAQATPVWPAGMIDNLTPHFGF